MEYKVWLSAFKTVFVSVCVRGGERDSLPVGNNHWLGQKQSARGLLSHTEACHQTCKWSQQLIDYILQDHRSSAMTLRAASPWSSMVQSMFTSVLWGHCRNLATSDQTGLWYWCCCCPVRHSVTFLQLYPGGILFNVQHSKTRSIWTVNPDFRSPLLLPLEKCSLSI